MGVEVLTDEKIAGLIAMPKQVTNPNARRRSVGRHEQVNYTVSTNDGEMGFEVFARQSIRLTESFSCGLLWISPSGEKVTLIRYNGMSHPHNNPIEGNEFRYCCHIHIATQRYIALNKQPETFAEETSRYRSLNGALACLIQDCAITGLNVTPDDLTGDLFNE